ncbi:MAG: 50S ribosomal protein L22 [Verrucomicrobiae bacterium]|nr:50S ribosomal protein L22 [Verrucomicrobiae bacterium]
MEVRSVTRFVRISAFKAREVTREIQGLMASDALDVLRFSSKKAARLITKTLKSAIANAEHNNDLKPATLRVKEAVVGEGPTIKRIMPRARGSASPIRKRTSHIRIILTDEPPPERRKRAPQKEAAADAQEPAEATAAGGKGSARPKAAK